MTDSAILDMNKAPTLASILEAPPMVSRHSRFDDDIWYLDGWTPGYTKSSFALHWTVAVDQQLIDAMKYLAALLFLERDGHTIYKHSTASTFSAGARHVLRFMEQHGYSSLRQLDADAIRLFTRNLHVALSDPQYLLEEIEADEPDSPELDLEIAMAASDKKPGIPPGRRGREPRQIDEEELTYSAAYNRLRPLQQLFDYQDLLERAGIPSIAQEPFRRTSVKTEAQRVAAIAVELIPPLPDEVALAIMSCASRLIMQPAEDVIELQRQCMSVTARLSREPTTEERLRLKAKMEAFRFSVVDGKPWHPRIQLGPDDVGGRRKLRQLIELIREAASTVILSGTGCRISENCSLETATRLPDLPLFERRDDTAALPACVSTRKSKTGLHQHFFMHGKLSKNQDSPKDEKWLIGSRPMDRVDVEPVVLRAIRVLEDLFAPWRSLARDEHVRKQLLISFRGGGLPASPQGVTTMTVANMRQHLRRFVASDEVGLQNLAPLISANPKLAPYVHSKGACIRPHQWRKTFALYMMRLDERMIPALANHFKHLSMAVTEDSYSGSDPSMFSASDSVAMMATARYFHERRQGATGSFGKLGRTLDKFQTDIDKLLGDLPLEEGYPDIEKVLLSHDLRIFHAEHGLCLIGANPDKARCHSAGGTSSWRRLKPNYKTRTPGLCAGCVNFVASTTHAGFWRRRYIDNQRAWLLSGMSADFKVIKRRAEQAASVLKALGTPLPRIELPNGTRGASPEGSNC
jgi:integrase